MEPVTNKEISEISTTPQSAGVIRVFSRSEEVEIYFALINIIASTIMQQTQGIVQLKSTIVKSNFINFTPTFIVDTNSIESELILYINGQYVTAVKPSRYLHGSNYVTFLEAEGGHLIFSALNEKRVEIYNAVRLHVEELYNNPKKGQANITRNYNALQTAAFDQIFTSYKDMVHISTEAHFPVGDVNRNMNLEIKLKSVSVATPFHQPPTLRMNWIIRNMYSADNSDLAFLDPVVETYPLTQPMPGMSQDSQALLETPPHDIVSSILGTFDGEADKKMKRGRPSNPPKAPKKPKLMRSNAMPH